MLEYILSHEECDVDPVNKLEGATPLHLAVALEDLEDRAFFVESLLDAGADFTFVCLVLGFSTTAMIGTWGLDTGYGIKTVKQHRNS